MEKRSTVSGRRKFLLASGTLALVGVLGNTSAQGNDFSENVTSFTRCFSSSNICIKYSLRSTDEPFSDLNSTASRSVATARACIEYFNNDKSKSNLDIPEGLQLAKAVVAGCGAVALLAKSQSPYLVDIAPTAVEICHAYQNYCGPHKEHKTCVDSAKACKDFIAAWNQMTETIEYDL